MLTPPPTPVEQIMLGLIGEGTGIAAKVLKSMGTSPLPARRRSPLPQRFATPDDPSRGALSTVEACKRERALFFYPSRARAESGATTRRLVARRRASSPLRHD